MKCATCNAERPTATRLPRGWKRHDDRIWCDECWRKAFVLRAITLPVAKPLDVEWPELRERLSTAWRLSTQLANWATSELALADVQRSPGEVKCPPMPHVYLYGLWRKRFSEASAWTGATQAVIALLNTVERKYRRTRYEAIWTRSRSVASYRYPYPFPIDADGWALAWDETAGPIASLTLPGGRVTVALRRGAEFRRQLGQLRQIAVQCEAAVYRKRIGGRSGQVLEDGGTRHRVMVKLVAWLPRKEATARAGDTETVLVVKTSPDAFVVAEQEGRTDWILNEDRLYGWISAHDRYRHRMAENLKFEKRWPKRTRERMLERLEVACDKQRNRLATWNHTAAKLVAELASRRHCSRVELRSDGTRGTRLVHFPWHDFAGKLAQKLDERGIAFVDSTGGLTAEPGPEKGEA